MIVEAATVTDSDGSVVPLANLQEDGSYAEPEAELEPSDDLDGEPTEHSLEDQPQGSSV
jgi:hypothetical protein